MLPKTIHYCWFGGKPKPKLEKKCIASWKKYCPDYEIIEWNESNYDLASAPLFVRQAIEAKKWAFATDYIRMKLLYDHGGIYLDTDVELIKPLDSLLDNHVYFGFEYPHRIASGLGFGAEKHSPILLEMMTKYESAAFIQPDGKKDQTWNTLKETDILLQHGLIPDGREQILDGTIHIYPEEYLHPLRWGKKKPILTDNTVSIHWYAGSWWDNASVLRVFGMRKAYRQIMAILRLPNRIGMKLLGKDRYEKLKRKLKK